MVGRRIGQGSARWLWPGLIVVGVVTLIVIAGWSVMEPAIATREYYPGLHLKVLRITYGMEHRITRGSPAMQLLERARPSFPGSVRSYTSEQPSLVVWVAGDYDPASLALYDDHGCPFGRASLAQAFYHARFEPTNAFAFENVPQRSDGLWLRPDYEKPFRLSIRPPARQEQKPIETPREPTRPDGEVTVGVTDLRQKAWGSQQSYSGKFTFSERGHPSADWRLFSIEVSDELGNRVVTQFPTVPPGGAYVFAGLCSQDRTWNLRCRVGLLHPASRRPDGRKLIRPAELLAAIGSEGAWNRVLRTGGSSVVLDRTDRNTDALDPRFGEVSLYCHVSDGPPLLAAFRRTDQSLATDTVAGIPAFFESLHTGQIVLCPVGKDRLPHWIVPTKTNGSPLPMVLETWKTLSVDLQIKPSDLLRDSVEREP